MKLITIFAPMKDPFIGLLTIKNYADKFSVTTSYIYKLIKLKRVQPVIIDGVKFIDTIKFPRIPTK